jgi:hypothetical protein
VAEEESCGPASERETDGVVEHPIALEGVADFGFRDWRSPSVELPPFRLLLSAAREEKLFAHLSALRLEHFGNASGGESADTKRSS